MESSRQILNSKCKSRFSIRDGFHLKEENKQKHNDILPMVPPNRFKNRIKNNTIKHDQGWLMFRKDRNVIISCLFFLATNSIKNRLKIKFQFLDHL